MKAIALIVIGYLILILIFIFRMYFYKKTSKSYVAGEKPVSKFYMWIYISIATFFLVFILIGQAKKVSIENDLDLLKSEISLAKIEMHCTSALNEDFKCTRIIITDTAKINKYKNLLVCKAKFQGNHPQTVWKINVSIFTSNNEIYGFILKKTNNSGMLVECLGKNPGDFSGASVLYAGNNELESLILKDFEELCIE